MIDKNRVEIIGFDLDGTLYHSTDEINDRIRNLMAQKILETRPSLRNVKAARSFFEERYSILRSGTAVLVESGVKNPEDVRNDCIARAGVADLLSRDEELINLLAVMSGKYNLYLLSSSPKRSSLDKLLALGVSLEFFKHSFFGDTLGIGSKLTGDAFRYAIEQTQVSSVNHLYVGDNPMTDILPAKRLGMQTVCIGIDETADLSINKVYEIGGVL